MKIINKIINALNQYAASLEKAAVWQNSRDIIGNVKGGKDDFIYEFYCYLRIIKDLKENYVIKYSEGAGSTKNKFPKKPANKKGRPYFKINKKDGTPLYHVCAGTKIKVQHGNKYDAPDISFQSADSPEDKPCHDHVKLIMDAKYIADKDGSVSKGSYNDFCMMIWNLDTLDAQKENISFNEFREVNNNCIISNRKAYERIELAYIRSHHLCEIENLNEEDSFNIIK